MAAAGDGVTAAAVAGQVARSVQRVVCHAAVNVAAQQPVAGRARDGRELRPVAVGVIEVALAGTRGGAVLDRAQGVIVVMV